MSSKGHSNTRYNNLYAITKQSSNVQSVRQTEIREQSIECMWNVLELMMIRHLRYPFQLLKQYFLFPDEDEESIEVRYKYMRCQMQIAVENIKAVSNLIRQKNLIDAFVNIKNNYNEQLRISAVYHCVQNLRRLTKTVITLESILKIQAKREGFHRIYQHFKHLKWSKISVSKISMASNEIISKDLDDFRPFIVSKGRSIDNSFIIDKADFEESEDQQYGANRFKRDSHYRTKKQVKQNINKEARRKTERKAATRSIKGKDEDLQKDTCLLQRKMYTQNSPINIAGLQEEERNPPTQRKQKIKYQDRFQTQVKENKGQVQQIFLINGYRSKSKTPTSFIKIPVVSPNIKIVQIDTGRRKKKQHHEQQQSSQTQKNSCENCKYCRRMLDRRDIMKVVQQKLAQQQRNNISDRLQTDNLLSSITFRSKIDYDRHGTAPSTHELPSTSRIHKNLPYTLNKQSGRLQTKQYLDLSKKLWLTIVDN